MFLLYGLVAVLACCLVRELYLRVKYDLHKIPSPKGLPILGHTIDLMTAKEITCIREKWHESIGRPRIFKVSLLGQTMLYINDPHCYKTIILSKSNPFLKIPAFNLASQFIGNCKDSVPLLGRTDNSEYVKTIRNAYLTALSTKNLKKFLPTIINVVDHMIAAIEQKREKGPVDVQDLCLKMTLDTIGAVAFERDLGGLDDSERFYQLLTTTGRLALESYHNPAKAIYCLVFPKSKLALERKGVYQDLVAEWEKLANECMKRDPPSDENKPLWYTLKILINPETGKPLSRELYRSELATVVMSGMSTNGYQLSWILGLLATHPRVADKLYEEIKHLREKKIELDELADLVYLSAVIKEGMRVCGAATEIIPRIVPGDMSLMGYRVPKGTKVSITNNRGMDSDADWGDAKVFRPERWIEEEIPPSRHFFQFSYGPRDCVGQRLGLLNTKIALIKLVLSYEFSSTRTFVELQENVENGMAVVAAGGMWLNIEPRG